MALFAISCLALVIIAFLITIAVQLIRIERTVIESARFLESKISRMYEGEAEEEK